MPALGNGNKSMKFKANLSYTTDSGDLDDITQNNVREREKKEEKKERKTYKQAGRQTEHQLVLPGRT